MEEPAVTAGVCPSEPLGMRDVDRLDSTLRHLRGRTQAFLLELAATERELALIQEPGAEAVLGALAAAQDGERQGSLAAVARETAKLLRLLESRHCGRAPEVRD